VKQILGNLFNFYLLVCVCVCVVYVCIVFFCASFVIGHSAVRLAH
jgi:hypothetical protein